MATFDFGDPPPGLNLSESRTVGNSVVAIILFVLSGVFVALRLFTRLKLKQEQLGCDDYLIIAGLALNAGNLACCIVGWWPIAGQSLDLTNSMERWFLWPWPSHLGSRARTDAPYHYRELTSLGILL